MPTTGTTSSSPTRRKFILGTATATAAVAVTACSANGSDAPVTGSPVRPGLAETSDPAGSILPELTPKAELRRADPAEEHASYLPAVPAPADRDDQRLFEVDLEVVEGPCPVDPANGVTTLMWGYRIAGDRDVTCGAPGPVVRGRVGDIARISLHNPNSNLHPHNIDFHSVTGQGGGAEGLTVGPGDTATIEVRLLYPGAFMYHCAFAPVVEHIARGMVGMFIVDPAEPLPDVDHEWGIVQSEWYVAAADEDGDTAYDEAALAREEPRYITFNGRTDALVNDNALHMEVGERARIYFVNAGLNLNSNFHPIGSHWDVVYPEGATHAVNRVIRGSQSTLVVAGGGTVAELVGLVPSTLVLVDHALARTFLKGTIGHIVVGGDADPEIFEAAATGAGLDPNEEPPAAADNAVSIPAGAFDPANADRAYRPLSLTVPVGTTVTWTNDDTVVHTVTSGRVSGMVGTPDGRFDSGDFGPGETWSHTFDTTGEFDYYCLPHPWMVGKVIVQ